MPQALGDLDSDGHLTVLDLTRLINHLQSTAGVPVAGGTGLLPVELRGYADVSGDGRIDQADVDMLAGAILGLPILTRPRPLLAEPAPGASEVGVTVRPRVYFPKPIVPATLNANNFYASFAGRKLPARIAPAADGTFAWLFLETNMPGASQIQVTVDGSSISVISGELLDADADLAPGGVFTAVFSTVSTVAIPNTSIIGQIVDPGPDMQPRTSDDVTFGPNGYVYLRPIPGVRVYLHGLEDRAVVTDANGWFRLDPVPAGDVKVVTDGLSATVAHPGFYWPEMVLDVHVDPGVTNYTMFIRDAEGQVRRDANGLRIPVPTMYLPRVMSNVLQTVSMTDPTRITLSSNAAYHLPASQQPYLTVDVAAGSLVGMDGLPLGAGQVGVSVVPPELVADMLPPGLVQHTFDITVQAPGVSTFSTPAAMTFPNVFNAPPGTQLNFLSFDHTTGRLVIEGTATVSADGLSVRTDPGSGVTHPGWHGLMPPGSQAGGPKPPCQGFGFADGVALLSSASECAGNLLPAYKSILNLIGAFADGFNLGQQVAQLYDKYQRGTVTKDEVLGTLEGLVSVKNRIADVVKEATKEGDPVARTIAIAKCVQGFIETSTGLICNRKECLSSFGNTVCDTVLPLEQFASKLIAKAEVLEKSIRDAPLDAVCLSFETLLTAVRVSSATPPGLVRAAGAAPDPAILSAMTNFLGLIDGFNLQAAPLQEILDTEAQTVTVFSNVNNNAVAPLALSVGALPGAFWHMAAGGTDLRGKASAGGQLNLPFIAASVPYLAEFYDPVHNLIINASGISAPSGVNTVLSNFTFITLGGAPDTDVDGLPDEAELVIGTDPLRFSTAGDGVSDGAKVGQGLDPFSGAGFATGVIAILPVPGEAKEVVLEGAVEDGRQQTAYLALGARGLGIVNASQFSMPILISQLDLPGDSTDVAVDASLRVAAVAANAGGLHIVSVADPARPALLHTFNIPASRVEVVEGVAYVAVGAQVFSYDLANRERVQVLTPGAGNLTDLARDGSFLYTMDASRVLRVIDVQASNMVTRGSLTLTAGAGRLFVGSGIAYVAAGNGTTGGFSTVNVSNPDSPTLLSGVDAANLEGDAIAANGSGLSVNVGYVRGPQGQSLTALDVVNISDPANTGGFLTRYALPVKPFSVAIGAGIAFVADGTAGLQVVNYLPFDNRGVAPAVTLTAVPPDLDANAAGIQVLEGSFIRVTARVSDDVQVRNVELLLDGRPVRNDVSFPFDLGALLPVRTPGATNVEVRVRATDTGGNIGVSAPLVLQLVPDTFPPTLVSVNPPDGAVRGLSFRSITARFSEPLNPASISAGSIVLIGPGGAVSPQSIQSLNGDTAVQLTFASMPTGMCQIVISGPAIRDRAGNALGAGNLLSSFEIRAATSVWSNPNGGYWDVAANWGGVLPGVNDDVLIDMPNHVAITNRLGTNSVRSVRIKNPFFMSGGTIIVDDMFEAGESFTLSGGILRGGTLVPARGITVQGGTLAGVRIDGDLEVGGSFSAAQLVVTSGLVLNGALQVGNPTNNSYGLVTFQGSQTLSGNGSVIFGRQALPGYNAVRASLANTTLTLGPGITVRGENGTLGYSPAWGGASTVGLINQGTLRADVAGGTIYVRAQPFLNEGVVQSPAGTVDLAGTTVSAGLGVFESTGGRVQLSGLLDNTNSVLVLDGPARVLTMAGGTLRSGTLVVRNGAALVFGTGTLEGVTINGPVDVRAGGTLSLTGDWTNGGVVNASNATVNLGGTFNVAKLGLFNRTGGAVNLTGTIQNTNTTLLLDGADASWTLSGGSIRGGIVTTTNGARLLCTYNGNNLLDGVTFNGELDVGNASDSAQIVVVNGLVLNGTARVGNPTNDWYGLITFQGSQTLGGHGSVIFGHQALAGYNAVRSSLANTTLTLGPDITVRGENGTLGYSIAWGGAATVGLTNRGAIRADVAGGTIYVRAQPFRNEGLVQSPAGTVDLAGTTVTAGLGTFDSTGGRVQLSGVLDNTNSVLVLDGPARVLTMAGGTLRSGTVAVTNGAALVFGTGTLEGVTLSGPVDVRTGGTLSLTGNWINGGVINSSNATVNLGGTFNLSKLGLLNRAGGTVNLTGTIQNTNTTLVLDGTNASWTLSGGSIRGGTVTATNGARLVCAYNAGNLLNGVTFNGELDVGNAAGIAQGAGLVVVQNGLVLNGTARVGNPTNDWYGVITFQGSQTLGGSGSVIFGHQSVFGYNAVRSSLANTTLTLGPGITVRGENGTLAYSPIYAGAANVGLTNKGVIRADVAGGTIYVRAQPFQNEGLLQSPAGTLDLAGTSVTAGLGNFDSTGGRVQLSGVLDNTNSVLVLDGPARVLTMAGGTLRSGTVAVTNGAALVFGTGTLEGVTLSGPVDAGAAGTLNLTGNWVNGGVVNVSNATVNLAGTFNVPTLGLFNRILGGTLNLTGALYNTNTTLLLDGTNASWTLSGGSIRGGTVTTTNGARLICAFNANNRLDGVTLNGEIDVGNSQAAGQVVVTNGLILNGSAQVGNPTNTSYGVVTFQGTQTLSGNGVVSFGRQTVAGYNAVRPSIASTALTLAPEITVRGENGTLGYSPIWGGPANVGVTNRGVISADVAGGTIYIRAQPFTNLGTTNQANGGRLIINP